LFLDEIGEAPPPIQVKLLRAIETGEFMRVGSEETVKSNVRLISATNRNLELEAEQNRFRADLLYRLEGVKLTIPPLRNRREDIPAIANHYLEKKFGGACRLDPETVEILKGYDWPGNVRQLLNVLNQAHSIHDCPALKPDKLPPRLFQKAVANEEETSLQKQLESFMEREIRLFAENITNGIVTVDHIDFPNLMKRIKKMEGEIGRKIIQKGLAETEGNRQLLSHKLRITERTLRYILNEK